MSLEAKEFLDNKQEQHFNGNDTNVGTIYQSLKIT